MGTMRETDIAIVGGGLAGATAAAMLGRAGIASLVVDPHLVYPPDFRCEKLDGDQVGLMRRTGLYDAIRAASTPDEEISIARFGRLVDRKPHEQLDILYDTLVNTVRAQIRAPAAIVHGKVSTISASDDRQRLTLGNGEEISARLIVLATGLSMNLRASLGIERIDVSTGHSVSIGFDMVPFGRPSFPFNSLTYFPEKAGNRMAYLTLFPLGQIMRANYFVYRGIRDPWLQRMRAAPVETITQALPRLKNLTGPFEVRGPVDIRPVDLYRVEGHRRSGVVLVGDAYCTSCPAAGTGVSKVFTDVERLCNVHIPRWLATPGMSAEKIAAFYDDPVKRACDEASHARAFFLRSLSTETGALWQARRLIRFAAHLGRGMLRSIREPRFVSARSVRHQAGGLEIS